MEKERVFLPHSGSDGEIHCEFLIRRITMKIEIRFIGSLVSVRLVRSGNERVRIWDELFPNSIHNPTGLSYDVLRQLGEGIHEI